MMCELGLGREYKNDCSHDKVGMTDVDAQR